LPSAPAPGSRQNRVIKGGRLLELTALQALLRTGSFDLDALVFGTRGARDDREKNRWRNDDVLQMLMLLKEPAAKVKGAVEDPNDYVKSEWCEVDAEVGMRWVACDVYRMNIDLARLERHRNGTEVYFKFSVEDDGSITIVMASCHPST
jgi:hypothetical protein